MEEEKKLIDKISIEMNKSRERQEKIDRMTNELYEETRPMMVEKRKGEIEEAKKEKEQFDEMNKNAILNAKKEIIEQREKAEEEFQKKLLETAEKQKDVHRKLESMKQSVLEKNLSLEIIEKAEKSAKDSLDKINNEMNEFQKENMELRNQLDTEETTLRTYAVELGFEEDFDRTGLEDEISEPDIQQTDENSNEQEAVDDNLEDKQEETQKVNNLTANDFMEDLLKIQQTTNAKDFDKLIDELGEKYADVSETWSKRIENALIKQKEKIDESIKNQAKQSEKPKKVTEPKETKQDDFSDILEIFNTKPETKRKSVDIDIPLNDKDRKKQPSPSSQPKENANHVVEGKFEGRPKTGKKFEPQYEDIIIDEDGTSHTDSKILISRIVIDEATGKIRAIDENEKVIYDKQYEYDSEEDFKLVDGEKYELEDREYIKFKEEKINKIQSLLIKQYGNETYKEKFKNLDGRIVELLIDLKDEVLLEDYIYSIFERNETMPFGLHYNLKDIYNTDMSLEEIKKVQSYSKIAYKQNREMVDIEKDSLPKRIFGKIKKGIKEVINTKLLGSGKMSDEKTVDRKNVDGKENEEPREPKKTIEGKDDFIYGIQHDSDGKKIDPYAMYEKLPSVDDDFIIASEEELKHKDNPKDRVDDYEDYKF